LRWRTWVFDCDGVLLNSNAIKSEAFYAAALPYGEPAARALMAHNKAHGGVTRQAKFRHFFTDILKRTDFEPDLERAMARFAEHVTQALRDCAEAPGLRDLLSRIKTSGGSSIVVSGGAQSEVRGALEARGLARYFDGIYGNPDDKDTIFVREIAAGRLVTPAVYIGDSSYDHAAAIRAGLDFVFASYWTDFADWRRYCAEHALTTVSQLSQLELYTPGCR